MTTTNPRPLVVWDNYTICPGCNRDTRIITDGLRVNCVAFAMLDATNPERVGTYLTVSCVREGKAGTAGEDYCGGLLTVDLATEEWTTEAASVDLLMADPFPVKVYP